MKILKGLTKELIKASKNKDLLFSKEELENIKKTAEVTYRKRDNGDWVINVYSRYYESCCGSYLWKGCFTWYVNDNKGRMEIFSGFTANSIGQIRDNYTCGRPYGTDYKKEFYTILDYMVNARIASKRADKAYCDYVARTGDLS